MEKIKRKFKVGDKVFLIENTNVIFGFEDGIEFEIKDILDLKVPAPYVLNGEQFGEDWVGFFAEDELILIEPLTIDNKVSILETFLTLDENNTFLYEENSTGWDLIESTKLWLEELKSQK